MEFSYAQGSTRYRQLLRHDVVVIFLDNELMIRHVSPNNDLLRVPVGTFSQELPMRKFMPDDAFAALREFVESGNAECVLAYEFITEADGLPVRHVFHAAAGEFNDGILLRSYIVRPEDTSAYPAIAAYETALGYIGLLNSLSVGTFSHDGHKINFVNQIMGELLGCEPSALLGEPVTKYFMEPGGQAPIAEEQLCRANLFSTGVRRRDGSTFAARVGVQVEEPGESYFATVEDATDYRSREQADAIFRRVFEHVSEGVLLLDTSLTVTWSNPAFTALMGYPQEAGWEVPMLYSDEHRPDFYESIWAQAAERVYHGTVWLRAQTGNLPLTAVITAIQNEQAEVLTYIAMLTHAPAKVKLTERAKDPNRDELTGLYTRARFEQHLEQRLADFRESGDACAVILIDIDRFKTINEMYETDCADMLLQQFAARLVKCMPAGTVLSRDDDEFTALIEDAAALADMEDFAERMMETLAKPFYIEAFEIDIYCSAGIVFLNDATSTKEALRKCLEHSLSLPKLEWKNSYHIHESAADSRQATLEEKLRAAIINNEFVLYYLPKVDARTQKLSGLEALARWRSPELGMVSPGLFIPVAEGAGLMPMLGELVFNMACRQLQQWNRKGFKDLRLAINVSSLQLRDENLAEKFINIMSSYDIDPRRIELELTQSVAFQERSVTTFTLRTLVEAGVTIALDDFGTGYSSISMLKKYPISILKIDRSFIKPLPDDADCKALVSTMIAIAHSLDMKAVAEGVETFAQYEYMTETDCDELQGFFIGVPSSSDEVEELIRSYAESELA